MIEEIDGDITKIDVQYICHQCNCVTNIAAHLAKTVFDKYPWSDIYSGRPRKKISGIEDFEEGEKPGDIIIRKNPSGKNPSVINMLGQVFPGKSKFPNSKLDGLQSRLSYFKSCLVKISEIKNIESIAFPDHIGCGAAGGDWEKYKKCIILFSEKMKDTKTIVVNFNN